MVRQRTGRAMVWVVLLMLAWAGQSGAGEKIRLALPATALSMLPVYVAKGLGFFSTEGLDVDSIATLGGGPEVKALAAGQVDFAVTSGDSVIGAYQQDQRLVMVFSGLTRPIINWAMYRDAASERGIRATNPLEQKLRALKGLTIGVDQRGALAQHLAEYSLRKAGLTPATDVRFLPLGSGPTWLDALASRRVAVVLGVEPLPEMAVGRGDTFLLINNAAGEDPSLAEFLMANLVVRLDYLQRNPETVRKMVRAMYRANRWALANSPEVVAEALQPFLPRTDAKALLSAVKIVLPAINPHGRTTERAVEITSEILEKAGLLKKKAPYAEIVTNEFVPG